MSEHGDLDTWRLRDSATHRPDNSTLALGPARDRVQNWAAVPLAGEDALPPSDPSTALLETVRAAPGDSGTDTPAPERRLKAPTEPALADADSTTTPITTEATTPLTTPITTSATPAATTAAIPTATTSATPTATTAAIPVAPANAWPSHPTPPVADAVPGVDGLVRFGPGVPAPGMASAAAVWHGTVPTPTAPARPRRRRRRGYVLIALVLLAVIGLLLWQRFVPRLSVAAVSVSTASGTVPCDGTALVTAAVRTHGTGTLRYHWARNDGTDSGPLSQKITAGRRTVRLPLRWTFHGHGTYRAAATLALDAPDHHTASVSFTYTCPR